jgi:hypothetical protein
MNHCDHMLVESVMIHRVYIHTHTKMDVLEGLSLAFGPSFGTSRPSGGGGGRESKRSTAPKPIQAPANLPSSFKPRPPPLPPRPTSYKPAPPPRPNLDTYATQRLAAERAMNEKQKKELAKMEKETKKAIEKQKKDIEKQRKNAEKKMKDQAKKQKHDLEKVAKEQAKKMKKQQEAAEAAAGKQRAEANAIAAKQRAEAEATAARQNALYANATFVDTTAMYQAQLAQQQQRAQQAQIPAQYPNLFAAGPLQQYHVAEWNIPYQKWEYRGVSGRDVVEYGVNPQDRTWHRMQPVGPAVDGTPFKR